MSKKIHLGLKTSRLEDGMLFLSELDILQTVTLYMILGSPNGDSLEGALVWLSAGFDNIGAHLRGIVAPDGTILINAEAS